MQPSGVSWWALWEFRKEKNTCDLTAIKRAGLLWTGNVKTQELAPDSWDTYERDDFSEPRCLHLPIHRKLNSLTWAIQFSFVNNHLWCSDYLAPLLQTFFYHLTPSPAFSEQFFRATWDVVSQAWSPKNSHQIKPCGTFRLWLYILSWQLQARKEKITLGLGRRWAGHWRGRYRIVHLQNDVWTKEVGRRGAETWVHFQSYQCFDCSAC